MQFVIRKDTSSVPNTPVDVSSKSPKLVLDDSDGEPLQVIIHEHGEGQIAQKHYLSNTGHPISKDENKQAISVSV